MDKKIFKKELQDWNRNAIFYAIEANSPFKKILRAEIKEKFLLSKRHKRILDLGAGTGDFAVDLASSLGSQVACIDFSPVMRRIALKKYPKLDYLTASAEKLPFKNNTFDAVIAIGILHHLKIQGILEKTLREVHRVLKPDGYFCYLDRSNSFLAARYEDFFSGMKSLFSKFKRRYSASSTSSETTLTGQDLLFLKQKFKTVARNSIYCLPFKSLLVTSNFLFYLFGKSFYLSFQWLFSPLAFLFEKCLNFKFLETEYCEVLQKRKK